MGGLEVNCNICKRPIEPHVYTQDPKYGMVCNDCGAKLANGQNPDQIINSLNNQEQRIHCCAVCRGQNNKCKYCWGTGAKDGKHPEPFGPFLGDYPWGSKWGLYDLESEQEYLLNEIKQANINVSDNYYPEDGPCVTLNCNNGNCTGCGKSVTVEEARADQCECGNNGRGGRVWKEDIRKRYLVSNKEGQTVYVTKTIGHTGNGDQFGFDGNKRELHDENTVGEFQDGAHGTWYSVYWRCQKTDHAKC